MSTSVLYHAYNIKGVQYKSFQKIKGGMIYIAEMRPQDRISCSKCFCKNNHFKGQKTRRFLLPPIAHKKCFLDLILHRL